MRKGRNSGRTDDVRGPRRRDVLKGMLAGAAGLALGGPGITWSAPESRGARARSVIQLWLWGGPCHIDTFDPKPDAGEAYCGPLNKVIPTNVDGIVINEKLPMLAKQADKYSILRSMTHGNNGHETASYIQQTGRWPGRRVYPCAGAVVSLFKGKGYKGPVPPYVVLTQPQGRFSEAGFLGQACKPFATQGDPNRTPWTVEGIVAPGISDARQKARRELLGSLDTFGGALKGDARLAAHDASEAKAYETMLGEARDLFDLAKEPDKTREAYGRTTFGQSCLAARRLVEAGVPWVTINYRGWDTHKQHFQAMDRMLPEMDRGMATLLEDLAGRGLLESTIVWWGGEFGRTPKVQWEPPWNGGRGHHGACFSCLVAGGGFKGGRVVGASDETGSRVAERPVYPRDLIASIYTLMGIDPEGPMPNPLGLDVKVLPISEAGEKTAGLLKEIM
jgi:hypothetical protein